MSRGRCLNNEHVPRRSGRRKLADAAGAERGAQLPDRRRASRDEPVQAVDPDDVGRAAGRQRRSPCRAASPTPGSCAGTSSPARRRPPGRGRRSRTRTCAARPPTSRPHARAWRTSGRRATWGGCRLRRRVRPAACRRVRCRRTRPGRKVTSRSPLSVAARDVPPSQSLSSSGWKMAPSTSTGGILQGNGRAPVGGSVQEVVGPVDGVDDPGPAAAARHGGALFAQDAVVGPAAPKLFQHVGLGGVVGGRDHVGDRRLLPGPQARPAASAAPASRPRGPGPRPAGSRPATGSSSAVLCRPSRCFPSSVTRPSLSAPAGSEQPARAAGQTAARRAVQDGR